MIVATNYIIRQEVEFFVDSNMIQLDFKNKHALLKIITILDSFKLDIEKSISRLVLRK